VLNIFAFFFSFVVVVIALAYVAAQDPQRCDAPNAFESYAVQIDPQEDDILRGKISYDDKNKRTAWIAAYSQDNTTTYYQHIHLYKEQMKYMIDLQTNDCVSKADSRPWHHYGVPPNATFFRAAYVGTDGKKDAGILVNLWGYGDNIGGRWIGSYTDKDCLPVTDAFITNSTGWVHTSFFDITYGISDPTVFDPPSSC